MDERDRVDGSGVGDDAEQSVLRLARRRRRGRRAGLAFVPAVLLAWFVVSGWDDGAPDASAVVLVVLLGGGVALGWWWLERSAGQSVADLHRGRADSGRFTGEELDDARAEVALRTCSPPPPGGRARVEGLADRWAREGRSLLWVAPFYAVVAAGLVLAHRADPDRGVPWYFAAVWVVLAGVGGVRGLRRRRAARRWLASHGAAPGVAGHR
ncbi:hypothetical protein SAMN03159343_2512 [Klenkia marina]|uniref:Uncharacterized protein n=1 Tax=Klenkia marina TaxID=1960309 RepID=A0A1G4YBL8_9ACTN|nr:hypothetical protein [Klenkia marina]SCX50907.1 hypothetical protein SAMN03159343_2512 [Klenkia marina]